MKLSEYLERQGRGAKAKFASQIGAHASDLSDWISGARPVPVHRCAVIEQETGGAVTRKDLRPSDWRAIWPELAKPCPITADAQRAVAEAQFERKAKTIKHGARATVR